jgi:hypothetical protein
MRALLPNSLVGADVGMVGARLGPPLRCESVGDEVHLGYGGSDGDLIPDAIVLVDGVVVRERAVRRSPPALHGYWIGQPIERLLATFGLPLRSAGRGVLQRLTFPAVHVFVHEGRVASVAPRAVTAAS